MEVIVGGLVVAGLFVLGILVLLVINAIQTALRETLVKTAATVDRHDRVWSPTGVRPAPVPATLMGIEFAVSKRIDGAYTDL